MSPYHKYESLIWACSARLAVGPCLAECPSGVGPCSELRVVWFEEAVLLWALLFLVLAF